MEVLDIVLVGLEAIHRQQQEFDKRQNNDGTRV